MPQTAGKLCSIKAVLMDNKHNTIMMPLTLIAKVKVTFWGKKGGIG
jgi:hypothetical protein